MKAASKQTKSESSSDSPSLTTKLFSGFSFFFQKSSNKNNKKIKNTHTHLRNCYIY